MADEVPALGARLRAEGVAVERITGGAGGAEDARETAALASRLGAEWIVLDGYQFSGEYQQRVREAGHRLLAVDDYGHAGHYWADAVLNQTLGADATLYARREPHTHLLLGTAFALLRREFRRAGAGSARSPKWLEGYWSRSAGPTPTTSPRPSSEPCTRYRCPGSRPSSWSGRRTRTGPNWSGRFKTRQSG